MVRVVLTLVCILTLMAVFDLSALRMAHSAKAWTVYLCITAVGLVLLGLYSQLFNETTSPLTFLSSWLKPWTGWLSV